LRAATHAQNMQNQKAQASNTSGYKGVSFHKHTGKWVANIRCNGKQNHLGLFDTPQVASIAYIEAAKRLHGEFASW
jgi:hypothetical protein